MRGAYIGILMMGVLHGYLKYVSLISVVLSGFQHIYRYTQPLFIQALMGLKNLYEAKPVAIHVLGKPAEGDLKRPFKTGGMFGSECCYSVLLPQRQPDKTTYALMMTSFIGSADG